MTSTIDHSSYDEDTKLELVISQKLTACSDISHGYAPPIYYKSPNDNKEYILISARFEDSYVYLYDILHNCWNAKWKYPEQLKPKFHAAVLNEATDILYLFGGHFNIFATLNLSDGQWDIKCYGNNEEAEKEIVEQYNIQYYLSFIPTFINDSIHIYHKGEYLTYNSDQQTFTPMCDVSDSKEEKLKFEENKMVHITAPRSKLLLIGGEFYCVGVGDVVSKDIRTFDIELNDKWKLLPVKLLQEMKYYRYIPIVAFGSILFIFQVGYKRDIWCLDTMITKTWYKSDKLMIKFSSFSFAVKTANNDVHFIKCDEYIHDAYHQKISLYDVIPNELLKIYESYYEKLVVGYIKREIEHQYGLLIPNALKDVVTLYFSCFQ